MAPKKAVATSGGPKSYSDHAGLARQIGRLFKQSEYSDVILEVGDEDPPRRFYAHRAILVAGSAYFSAMLTSGYRESKQSVIPVREVDPDAFELVLEFIYTGQVEISPDIALGVHAIATRFQVDALRLAAEKCIAASMSKDDVVKLMDSAQQFETPFLAEQCMGYIVKNANKMFKSGDLENLHKDVLLQLLQDEKLAVTEINVFRGVLRWAERNRGSMTIAEAMAPFVDHIRYGCMDAADIRKYVIPTGAVPPEYLIEALFYLTAPVKGEEKRNLRLRYRKCDASGRCVFDKKRTHTSFTLSKGGRTAATSSTSWCTAATSRVISRGKHYVEFNVQAPNNIMLGVCNLNTLNTQGNGAYTTSGGYMWYLGANQAYNGGNTATLDAAGKRKGQLIATPGTLSAGDKFAVQLDMNKRQVEFFWKGKSLGIAYKNIPKGKYVFCCDIYSVC
eukprot:TRINITY_DN2448_c0_g1_i1.p1 TRINITY_DN2448_c0_g1~~TRINITY_DN2448_c0_g1_i1.p1  ORF type:complete len:473 (-),score=88.15 TRINITY_DN2448_c0_g1_i1:278-1621(-)